MKNKNPDVIYSVTIISICITMVFILTNEFHKTYFLPIILFLNHILFFFVWSLHSRKMISKFKFIILTIFYLLGVLIPTLFFLQIDFFHHDDGRF